MSLKSLTGFRDFYPEDCALREWLFQAWKESCHEFGFQQVDGPPLEQLELFTRKSGDEIKSQLYDFQDKGGRDVALRPEMTPTLARMIGARQRDYKKPLKWFSIPQVFRYEKPQKGRLREHYQWNCDIVGEAALGAEADLIALLVHALTRLGLQKQDFVVRISDRQFWQELLESHNLPVENYYEIYQALDKIERAPEEVTREKLGDLADPVFEALRSGKGGERLEQLFGQLDALGIADCCKVDLSIVRGLAYYTGVVFEVHDAKGEYRAIAGGGRYDGLINHLCGVDLPALGFGMGDVVISEMLNDKGLGPAAVQPKSTYLVIADEAVRPDVLALAGKLRSAGYRVDYPLSPSKVGKQFQAAEDRSYSEALVLDAKWKGDGICACKDLKERQQHDVRIQWDGDEPQFIKV
ncbi:MAG: histidine--tRNA ligase [Verrucomicrobiota bacterium]